MVIRAPFKYHEKRQTLGKIVFETAIIDANLMKGTAMTTIDINLTSHPAPVQYCRVRWDS